MKLQSNKNKSIDQNNFKELCMSYFSPFGKVFLPAKTTQNEPWWTDRSHLNPHLVTPRGILIDLFPELAQPLREQDRTNSIMKVIEDLQKESFPMVADSSELDHTYVVNVPEITSEDNITIDVSDDKKQIDVVIEVRRQDETTNAVETMKYSWRSAREIDIDNMEAYLDKENSQLVVYSPYVVEEDETQPEEVEEKIVNLSINKGTNSECECNTDNCCENGECEECCNDGSCESSDDTCEQCSIEDSSQKED